MLRDDVSQDGHQCGISGHGPLALRADWQRQLRQCHEQLGFHHVRFHDILSDDMGTLMDEQDHLLFSFFNADQICDFLLSIGMKPFIELSFMPSTLSSGSKTVFHYGANVTPPKDYSEWAKLITRLVTHWVERYGIDEVRTWFFEVWNEPNMAGGILDGNAGRLLQALPLQRAGDKGGGLSTSGGRPSDSEQ